MSGLEQNKLSLLSVTFVEIEAIFQNKFKMAYIYIYFFFPSIAGEPMADMVGDCRRGGVRG